MVFTADNRGERDYPAKVAEVAERLAAWTGPIVLLAHVDPDGDALGSTLALKRALDALGKTTILPMEPPAYLAFLATEGELSPALDVLPEGSLLAVLDVADAPRAWGAPFEGAGLLINVDHHGTNDRFGDVALVEPGAAATAQIVKDVIDAMPVAWTPEIATPCLTGIMTDTGTFRFANTDRDVLVAAGDLIAHGVAYTDLADRLQWRPHAYYRMLGAVMETIEFPLEGKLALATVTEAIRERAGAEEGDSDDFVGLIRYAEGTVVAALLKQKEDAVKISVRTRGDVSAQAICLELGGGGHVAAAGAKLNDPDLAAARAKLLSAVRRELERNGLI